MFPSLLERGTMQRGRMPVPHCLFPGRHVGNVALSPWSKMPIGNLLSVFAAVSTCVPFTSKTWPPPTPAMPRRLVRRSLCATLRPARELSSFARALAARIPRLHHCARQILPNRIAQQLRAHRDLPSRHPVPQMPASNNTQYRHVDHPSPSQQPRAGQCLCVGQLWMQSRAHVVSFRCKLTPRSYKLNRSMRVYARHFDDQRDLRVRDPNIAT